MNEILFTVTFGYYLISVKENIYRILATMRKARCMYMTIISLVLHAKKFGSKMTVYEKFIRIIR